MYSLSAFVKLCMEEGVISMIFFLYLDVICLSKMFGLCFQRIPRHKNPRAFINRNLAHGCSSQPSY